MRNNGLNPRVLLGLVVIVIVAGGVAVAAIGGQSGEQAKHAQALAEHFDAAGLLTPAKPAPPLKLRNYLGQPVNIDSYWGKAVLVTFLYTNRPRHSPPDHLEPARSAEPARPRWRFQGAGHRGVGRSARRHAQGGGRAFWRATADRAHAVPDRLAQGTGRTVWQAWGVGSARDAEQPQFINHTGIVYGITASGKRLTVYARAFNLRKSRTTCPSSPSS